ncbi:hypothetical protein C8R47DRAFT_1328019 [Mycena vitilis]|nr:hypothetical protein C8R47DRAFT_1328019 [Mycena vitilis]
MPKCTYNFSLCIQAPLGSHRPGSKSDRAQARSRNCPPIRYIISEAERIALDAFTDALRRRRPVPKAPRHTKDLESPESPTDGPVAQSSASRSSSMFMTRKPEDHQVFRAIEDQDLSLLAEIAEHDFPLLLRPLSSGTNRTPLNHAIDCGASHRGVALLLLGMFSRYINHLSDEDFDAPATRETLRLLRVNFTLAMNRGVMQADTTVAASFLQVYIMSKGQAWLSDTVLHISIALRSTTPGEAVTLAGHAVRRYAGKTLRKDEIIAALEDYIGNATADLLMMGAWTFRPFPPIRVFNAFAEKLDLYRELVYHSNFVGNRLRGQLTALRRLLEGRATTYRSKIMAVDRELSGT